MQKLKERILRDGKCYEGEILQVDNFINHQIDPILMYEIATEFVAIFGDQKIDKVLTLEASGIAPAIFVAYLFKCPLLFAKKKLPKTIQNPIKAPVHSFTKEQNYEVCISRNYLLKDENILVIDDFLAYGNAAIGMKSLIDQAGANLVGMGFVIEKEFQKGAALLRSKGIRVESLAVIKEINNGQIIF